MLDAMTEQTGGGNAASNHGSIIDQPPDQSQESVQANKPLDQPQDDAKADRLLPIVVSSWSDVENADGTPLSVSL